MEIFIAVIIIALVFEYINGFHDTANSIATVVATKVLSPRQAVTLAAICNLIGALSGTAVASTIGKGLVDISYVTSSTIFCGLLAGIIWNLLTWWWGLPSSSSHALIGGLVGSTLAAANTNWNVIKFSELSTSGMKEGLLHKVIIPMIISPLIGLIAGFIIMCVLYLILIKWKPQKVNQVFGKLQLCSSAWMGYSHGLNDAQKTMGIIALALVSANQTGVFSDLPEYFNFLKVDPLANGKLEIANWIKIICALTMAAGTWAGGWKIIRTLGHKLVALKPVHGFAAETTSALIIQIASSMGIPLSTTHIISTSIMGVGAAKRFSAVRWTLVERMIWAWILTIPICSGLGYCFVWCIK